MSNMFRKYQALQEKEASFTSALFGAFTKQAWMKTPKGLYEGRFNKKHLPKLFFTKVLDETLTGVLFLRPRCGNRLL